MISAELLRKAVAFHEEHQRRPGPEDLGIDPHSGDYQNLAHRGLALPSGPWGALGPGPDPTGPTGHQTPDVDPGVPTKKILPIYTKNVNAEPPPLKSHKKR